jgi:hypothetical protein
MVVVAIVAGVLQVVAAVAAPVVLVLVCQGQEFPVV